MKLYFFPIAPNPTKVRTYLAEKGIEIELELVSFFEGAQNTPEFRAKNPLGKLPVLELDDGSILTESLAIMRYLEELHPEPNMVGTTPLERARISELERICENGVLSAVARYIHATKSPLDLPPKPQVAEVAWENLQANLEVLDARVGAGPFVAGDRVTIADCTLWAGFNFAKFRDVEIDAKYANLLAWRERFADRPSTQI
ncbi:MAG: glutathione S-transferase family protein [Myxococcota bacterium]